ncbi:MAG: PQQ-binding-like beta-propeller repeat protein [Methanoregula sp.]|jgi:hypothetical protein|nr:PQQ-binding-like beta-propeller repeat protein [Methanoregula sp.]
MDISFDGDKVAVVTDHNLSILFANGSTRWKYTSEPQLRSVAVSGDGGHVAVGSQYFLRTFNRNGSIEWVFDNTKLLSHGNSAWVNAVSLSTNGEYTAAGVSENIFFLNKSGGVLWEYASPAWIQRVSISDDGSFFVASTRNDVFFFNRWGNGSVMETTRGSNDDLPKTGIQGITTPS